MKKKSEYELCAGRLKALADPDRLRIVEQLFSGPLNVSQLSEALEEEIVKVSHHLGVLRHADVVRTEKQGRFVIYSLHPDVVAVGKNESMAQARRIDFGCCSIELESKQLLSTRKSLTPLSGDSIIGNSLSLLVRLI